MRIRRNKRRRLGKKAHFVAKVHDVFERITCAVLCRANDSDDSIDSALLDQALFKFAAQFRHVHPSAIVNCDVDHIALANTGQG
jgi:hypothetical protein